MLSPTTNRFLAVMLVAVGLSNSYPLNEPQILHKIVLPRYPISRRATQTDYVDYAIAASNQMETWYNAATGLWDDAWWNSANVLTTLADFAEHFPSSIDHITDQVFPTTLAQAPTAFGFNGFLNGYYDDELWWTLAWIKVYDVTGQTQYLDMAAQIFEDAKDSYGSSNCGALWQVTRLISSIGLALTISRWDKAHSGTNAVENALYLTAAAKLANRKPSSPSGGYYYNEAVKSYDWFINSGLINSDNLINDHLNASCINDLTTPIFTYNQGIILSGLTELAWAAPADAASSMNALANTLALAGLDHFTDAADILHEPCEPNWYVNLRLKIFSG